MRAWKGEIFDFFMELTFFVPMHSPYFNGQIPHPKRQNTTDVNPLYSHVFAF